MEIINGGILELNEYKEYIIELLKEAAIIYTTDKVKEFNYEEKRFEKLLEYKRTDKAHILLAKEDRIIVGYLWYFFKDSKTIHINSFIVSSKYRGMGIGYKLYDFFEEKYSGENLNIELHVNPSNHRAIKFYEDRGLKKEMILMRKE